MAERNRLDVVCDRAGWMHSRRLRCVGYEWSILTNDPALIDDITYLYEACADGSRGPARHVFIVRRHTNSGAPFVSVYRDGQAILRRVPAGLAIAQLIWEVNRGVVEEAGNRVLLHAAAAQRDEGIVLLAGPEGSGKSTLVTALVRSGLRYVTDEIAAVELPSGTITPYPKPIALHDELPEPLREVFATLPHPLQEGLEQRLVPAQAIRRRATGRLGGFARLLVFLPTYRPGRVSAARPIARAEAAIGLAEQAFNFRALGPGRLDCLAEVVRACECYRLDVGTLDAACRLVLDLLERAVARQ
jgi:hypothetical protein